jgi:beta-glucanase (GH16 family)
VYGGWPNSGEIDVMESRGNKAGYTVGGEAAGCDAFGSTLHYGAITEYQGQSVSGTHSRGGGLAERGWGME